MIHCNSLDIATESPWYNNYVFLKLQELLEDA